MDGNKYRRYILIKNCMLNKKELYFRSERVHYRSRVRRQADNLQTSSASNTLLVVEEGNIESNPLLKLAGMVLRVRRHHGTS